MAPVVGCKTSATTSKGASLNVKAPLTQPYQFDISSAQVSKDEQEKRKRLESGPFSGPLNGSEPSGSKTLGAELRLIFPNPSSETRNSPNEIVCHLS
ncbi:hypothetical protein TWF730_005197 [Orbilia blumenaviensis]|uniref:Uncharacterized protein n=1 Tax=Orbilia blumenaviensis TaxID=1796055 RepID=A0AAV9VI15_9PEZI